MLSMDEYYKVLHYLPRFKVDRQYPTTTPPPVYTGTAPFFTATNHRDYTLIDHVEMKITTGGIVDPSLVTLGFCESANDTLPILTLPAVETEKTAPGRTGFLTFMVNNKNLSQNSRKLSNIARLSIDPGQSVVDFQVKEVVFKTTGFVCTLEDLERCIKDGEDYILRELGNPLEMPVELVQYKYHAAAAYAWLIKWEHEARVMDTGQKESKNYADRLFGLVDKVIAQYQASTEPEPEEGDEINDSLIGCTNLNW